MPTSYAIRLMPRICYYITVYLLAMLALSLQAAPVDDTRIKLIENQRNIIHIRKEKQLFQKELSALKQDSGTRTNRRSLQAEIDDIEDSLEVADVLIANITILVSRQRMLLATLERGSPPSALDVALNKALNSNLPELAKNLSNNEQARKEVSRLRALLKQQARLGSGETSTSTSVSVAVEQRVAEDEFLRLLSLFSGGSADEADDKNIKITGSLDGAPFTEEDVLSYLGHQQYHMETTVYAGKMTFTVDGRPWQLSVPEEENKSTYVIIYDIGDRTEPRLVMFNKLLLLE